VKTSQLTELYALTSMNAIRLKFQLKTAGHNRDHQIVASLHPMIMIVHANAVAILYTQVLETITAALIAGATLDAVQLFTLTADVIKDAMTQRKTSREEFS